MRHEISQTLFAYWNEVRGDRAVPRRFEIDPSKIAGLLPNTFILERLNDETYRYRLAGTQICEIVGCELRGTNFLDGWPTEDRGPLLRQFSVVVRQGAVAVLHLEASALCEKRIACEVLLLPLKHSGDVIDRILGSFGVIEPPSWLGDKPLLSRRLIANELIWPGHEPHTRVASLPAEKPALLATRDAKIVRSERRQFRVYDGGRGRPESEKL